MIFVVTRSILFCMNTSSLPKRPRGRPSKHGLAYADTKQTLIRRGIEMLTEQGMIATSLDELMRSVQVPKGSFYHYFTSKDAFVLEVVNAYNVYFLKKLDRFLLTEDLSPMQRIAAFVQDAGQGMQRYAFKRGCLVGNLGQEASYLDGELINRLESIFREWEVKICCCLQQIPVEKIHHSLSCEQLAHQFWIGWEGAVLRARLVKSEQPLHEFYQLFKMAVLSSE